MQQKSFNKGCGIAVLIALVPVSLLAFQLILKIQYSLAGMPLAQDINNYYLEEMSTSSCVHKSGSYLSPEVVAQLQDVCKQRGPVRDFIKVPWNETTIELVAYVRRKTYRFRESFDRDEKFKQVTNMESTVEYNSLGNSKSVLQKQGKSSGL